MNSADYFSYFLTLIAISLAPGPVALMLMARSATKDTGGALCFGVGFAIGGLLIIAAVCFGLSAWLTAVPEVFEYSKYAMMAYILWLARGIWKGGFDMNGTLDLKKSGAVSSIFAGIATCAISPYMMILFPLVLPGMMNINTIQMPDFLIVAAVTFTALVAGAAIIIGFAAQLTRLVRNSTNVARINRGLATLLVLGGGAMTLA